MNWAESTTTYSSQPSICNLFFDSHQPEPHRPVQISWWWGRDGGWCVGGAGRGTGAPRAAMEADERLHANSRIYF